MRGLEGFRGAKVKGGRRCGKAVVGGVRCAAAREVERRVGERCAYPLDGDALLYSQVLHLGSRDLGAARNAEGR